MIVGEIYAKTILSKSKVLDYTINPYIGCEHGCTYCYARYMKRFTGHKEEWGHFVDAKINAAKLLQREIKGKRVGRIWVSGTCDPYQPLEKRYELTKECLNILSKNRWPITIQTKSPLVLRDIELLRKFDDIEVGITITTADDSIRRIFEPNAPAIKERIETVEKLHSSGLKTFVMIAPMLPKTKDLAAHIGGRADHVLIDKMNYHYADWVYRNHNLEHAMTTNFFTQRKEELAKTLDENDISYQFLF